LSGVPRQAACRISSCRFDNAVKIGTVSIFIGPQTSPSMRRPPPPPANPDQGYRMRR
jgi:hypothetical protein